MSSFSAEFQKYFPSQLEFWAFLTSLVGVWLMTKQWLIAWPAGLVGVVLYARVFINYKLYADAGLQVFFFAMLVYGWWHWLHPQPGRIELPVTRVGIRGWGAYVFFIAGAALLISQILRRTDSTTPYWDATTCAMSLAAQWMQARKQLENWTVWIVADVLYIGLYIYKGLNPTAVLYGIFCALAVTGHVQWWRSMKKQDQHQPASAQ